MLTQPPCSGSRWAPSGRPGASLQAGWSPQGQGSRGLWAPGLVWAWQGAGVREHGGPCPPVLVRSLVPLLCSPAWVPSTAARFEVGYPVP